MAISISSLTLLVATFLAASTLVSASPIISLDPVSFDLLIPRDLHVNNASGVPEIVNSDTQSIVPQGPATDGSGTGFAGPAILWIVFSALIGVPMAMAGFRGWRLTTAVAMGLTFAGASWTCFVNAVSGNGIPDPVLTGVVLVFFCFGCCLGAFEFARLAGIMVIGLTGGLAFGARVMIIRENLLINSTKIGDYFYPLVLFIVGFCGVVNASIMLWKQREGILFGCASTGTFFTVFAIDLVLNRQSGMSRGMRFLIDRNSAHLADLFVQGYNPPISTQILLGVSLLLTPALAYAQHRIFKEPFSRNELSEWKSLGDGENPNAPLPVPVAVMITQEKNVRGSGRFGGLVTPGGWGMKSRFSL